jgi:hypothetical protein
MIIANRAQTRAVDQQGIKTNASYSKQQSSPKWFVCHWSAVNQDPFAVCFTRLLIGAANPADHVPTCVDDLFFCAATLTRTDVTA